MLAGGFLKSMCLKVGEVEKHFCERPKSSEYNALCWEFRPTAIDSPQIPDKEEYGGFPSGLEKKAGQTQLFPQSCLDLGGFPGRASVPSFLNKKGE